MARRWLSNCVAEHGGGLGHCPSPQESPRLPTRVIDVGLDGFPPRLWESGGLHASYCALSYCWGTGKVLCTTSSTLRSHLREIPYEKLPKTLRDAICVTRQLGVKYLWIHSLCIIQDDEKDWRREAAQMGTVYTNTHVVITALASDNSDGGLFRDRDEASVRPVPLTASFPEPHGNSCRYVVPSGGDWKAGEHSPISTRAWTLQEQVLCARMLSFGADQLRWICLSMCAAETDPDGAFSGQHSDSLAMTTERQILRLNANQAALAAGESGAMAKDDGGLSVQERDVSFQAWEKIVTKYSARVITKQADRIPAILGVARRMEVNLNNRFVAGVWKGDYCLRSLSWQAETPGALIAHYPTWSWASTTSLVQYTMLSEPEASKERIEYQASVIQFDELSSEVQPTIGCCIKIKGKIKQTQDTGAPDLAPNMYSTESLLYRLQKIIIWLMRDSLTTSPRDPTNVSCLFLRRLTEYQQYTETKTLKSYVYGLDY
ncbi:heterokaryon incompatibility protein [Colletotrichum truncatum]|uniref:Heterokaryon incompatibility protein n=1 Tax=Colletotrichum truncatum TaxID=5467 RepID=A0ACC3YP05_COLTU